jgi:CRISPR-associated protein Csb2
VVAIEVVFLTGRYIATAYNSRTEGEWPPHPARLFSALVATHFAADHASDQLRSDERAVLEWLERQGAPLIGASAASARDIVTVFVPVNDVGLTDVDEEAAHLDRANSALSTAEHSGEPKAIGSAAKGLRQAQVRFDRALAKAVAVPAAAVDVKAAAAVLPDSRTRQPRTFPSVTPEVPIVEYTWPAATLDDQSRRALAGLLSRVVRLGHSSSLVRMRLADSPGQPTLHPMNTGEITLRVVEAGQLVALEQSFRIHNEIEPRVMPARQQPYGRPSAMSSEAVASSVFSADWLVFRRTGGPFVPMVSTAALAARFRRALMSFADHIPEVLSGHRADRSPSDRPHLAVVPLPFVGHEHATGSILGIALVLPKDVGPEERRTVFQAVANWESTVRADDEDVPVIPLHLGPAGEMRLERIEWGGVAATLRPDTWCRPSLVWSSATPVALDQNPGDLRSRDSAKLRAAIDAAEQSVSAACARIGLPRPTDIEILPAAPWANAAKARAYPRFPEAAERTQRVLTHVRIHFADPVAGPVILGAGRYQGLGLCRPEVSR